MSDVDFFRTRMGLRFYEHTLPELVRQLTRIADALERQQPQPAPGSPQATTDAPTPGSRP